MEHETVEGHGHGVRWTLERYASESSQVPTHLETPRESTLRQKAVDEPWNTPPRQEEKLQIQDRECIALNQQIKCGGQKGSMTCCEHAGSNPGDVRARAQDIVDNEVAQTDSASSNVSPGKTLHSLSNDSMQSSSSDTALSSGRPAPKDSHMVVAAVAESSTTQSTTSSTIRVAETEGQSNTECQKVLASRSDRHGTIADMDTCGVVVLTTDPEDCDGWTQ